MSIITIDGPASSGKGTVARMIAEKLGYHYLDSGSIYRALALTVTRYDLANGTDFSNSNDVIFLTSLIKKMRLEFISKRIKLDGEDVTDLIRDEKIGILASNLAKIPEVRVALLDFQRSFAKEPGLVTDGRDMGSIVFPSAKLKVFLTASPEVRAQRRVLQLQSGGKPATIAAVLTDIRSRDLQDSKRKAAPLMYDDSFKVLDNSDINIDETVNQILKLLD